GSSDRDPGRHRPPLVVVLLRRDQREDQHDQRADAGYQPQQQEPARQADVVQSPHRHGQRRQQQGKRQQNGAKHRDRRGRLRFVEIAQRAVDHQPHATDDHHRDKTEQGKAPIFLAPRASAKAGAAAARTVAEITEQAAGGLCLRGGFVGAGDRSRVHGPSRRLGGRHDDVAGMVPVGAEGDAGALRHAGEAAEIVAVEDVAVAVCAAGEAHAALRVEIDDLSADRHARTSPPSRPFRAARRLSTAAGMRSTAYRKPMKRPAVSAPSQIAIDSTAEIRATPAGVSDPPASRKTRRLRPARPISESFARKAGLKTYSLARTENRVTPVSAATQKQATATRRISRMKGSPSTMVNAPSNRRSMRMAHATTAPTAAMWAALTSG